MEKKNLRTTEGLPMNFGIAAGIFLLLSTVLSMNLSQAYMQSVISNYGLPSSMGMVTIVTTVITFLLDPGIFLFLLFRAKNKPRRGTTFSIVWIVIAAISLVSGVVSLFSSNSASKEMSQIAETLLPGGMMIAQILSFLGYACMIASCVFLLLRFRDKRPKPAAAPADDKDSDPPAA